MCLDRSVNKSKFDISQEIDSLINGEYEIDRQDIVEKIRKENNQFISIQGDAGSGKSALCKKLLEPEQIVLYARAERFAQMTKLQDIWDIDIKKTLFFLNGKKLVFFIDALEFIADEKKEKMNLLNWLYETVKGHDNVKIITTCRTIDKNAFLKMESAYGIQAYPINELTDKEIDLVAEKYPVIGKVKKIKAYAQLIRSPFYLNLIVTKIHSIDDISDINEFRNTIWYKLICLEDVTLPIHIRTMEIKEAVNKIVFTRAKEFIPGVPVGDIDHEILQVLISEGVVIETAVGIRLKYDIYEDICFEKFIDDQFTLDDINFKQFRNSAYDFYYSVIGSLLTTFYSYL